MVQASHPPFDVVVRGNLVLPTGQLEGAIGIRNGRIAAIAGREEALPADELIEGPLVLPGGIDAHVHTHSSPSEDMRIVSRFAATGGITTILDMPYDVGAPVTTVGRLRSKMRQVEEESAVDVGLWATVDPQGPTDDAFQLAEAGAIGFKLSLFDTDPERFPQIPDGLLLELFETLAASGLPIGVHCENNDIVRHRVGRMRAEGRIDPEAHGESRPPVAETEAVGRALELARGTGASVHIVHASTGRAIEQVRLAARQGLAVSVETCLHYLLLDEADLKEKGSRLKINPPLRAPREREMLWSHLTSEEIDLVASDHVAWPVSDKDGPILEAKSGVPGVGLLLPLLFHEMVSERGLPIGLFADLVAHKPARRFGLSNKGAIRVGADADLVIIDPDRTWTVEGTKLEHPCGWSPYEGRLASIIETVLARGVVVAERGQTVELAGRGRVVRPIGRMAKPGLGGPR